MASWPRDERDRRPIISQRKKYKVVDKIKRRDYPNLEPGLIGAATLLEHVNNKLEWDFLVAPAKDVSQNRLSFGKRLNVFPPSRPLSTRNTSRTVRQRAEQGANFLRTYLPDVEIPSELIRDQLLEETQICEDLKVFDSHAGNLLDISPSVQTPDLALLLFPTGDTNRDLSLSYISCLEARKILFKPTASPLHTFSTPIQQIVTSHGPGVNLVVRTYSSTEIFNVKYPDITATPTKNHLGTLSRIDTNQEVIVDVKCLPSSEDLLVISDGGTLFNCSFENGRKSVMQLQTFSSVIQNKSGFWRLSLESGGPIAYVMSEKSVQQIDIRTNTVQSLMSITDDRHVLTSIESCEYPNLLPLCSTDQIIWMDTRYAGRPLLAYSHGRQYDRYLQTHTMYHRPNNPLTFLTSRHNGMVTVYDVSCSSERPIHLNNSPYLPQGNTHIMYQRYIGERFVLHNKTMGLLRLSEQKGVEYTEILPSATEPHGGHIVELVEDVIKWSDTQANVLADIGPFDVQEFSEVNLSSAYEALFQAHFEYVKEIEEDNSEAIYSLLDNFPRYLQSKELPADHILTTYDIAFCAGDQPEQLGRADFFTQSMIYSKRCYRALKQGHLSPQLVRASWHRSIFPVLRHLDTAFPAGPEQSMEYLRKFRAKGSEHYTNKAHEYEQDACEQLTTDLILACDIFLDTPIFKAAEVNALEAMTRALSIGDRPPPIQFGYLRPVEKTRLHYDGDPQTSEGLQMPLGVRLLLKDWDSGNPDDYHYQDPYDTSPLIAKKLIQPALEETIEALPLKSQRPPQILASNATTVGPHEIFKKSASKAQSQDRFPFSRNELIGSQSRSEVAQDLAVSTQIMPGLHGGRPGSKKKTIKKRLGGF